MEQVRKFCSDDLGLVQVCSQGDSRRWSQYFGLIFFFSLYCFLFHVILHRLLCHGFKNIYCLMKICYLYDSSVILFKALHLYLVYHYR